MGKEIEFDDPNVKADSNFRKEYSFKLEGGRIDVIRMLAKPQEFHNHWIPDKQTFINCCLDGGAEKCPACEAGYARDTKYAYFILWISAEKNRRKERVGKPMVWVMSSTKFCDIRDVAKIYGDLTKVYLRIACSDTGFQKIGTMLPLKEGDRDMMDKDMVEEVKVMKADNLLDRFTEPDTVKKASEKLERGSGETFDEPDLGDPDKGKSSGNKGNSNTGKGKGSGLDDDFEGLLD